MRVKGLPIGAFTLRLADELEVTSVTSSEFGPLLFFRVTGQNNLFVSLPSEVPGGTEFTVTVSYAGDLRARQLEETWIASRAFLFEAAGLFGVGEPRYVYSSRSYWYPQALVTDYATATLELTVPPGWGVIASGSPLDTKPAGHPVHGGRTAPVPVRRAPAGALSVGADLPVRGAHVADASGATAGTT